MLLTSKCVEDSEYIFSSDADLAVECMAMLTFLTTVIASELNVKYQGD